MVNIMAEVSGPASPTLAYRAGTLAGRAIIAIIGGVIALFLPEILYRFGILKPPTDNPLIYIAHRVFVMVIGILIGWMLVSMARWGR